MTIAFSGCVPIPPEPMRLLRNRESRFAEVMEECDSILLAEAGWGMQQLWESEDAVADLLRNFPLMVALQIGIFESVEQKPDAVIGMSCGEVSAAYACGALGLRDALKIAIHGAKMMDAVASECRMALVFLSKEECLARTDRLSIAAVMEPGVTVVSGLVSDIDTFCDELRRVGIRVHPFQFPWGAHTALFPERHLEFESSVGQIDIQNARCPAYSTSLGAWTQFNFNAADWWRMYRSPVLFFEGISSCVAQGFTTYLEIGPVPTFDRLLPRLGASVVTL